MTRPASTQWQPLIGHPDLSITQLCAVSMTKHDASSTKQSDFFVSLSGTPGHWSLTPSPVRPGFGGGGGPWIAKPASRPSLGILPLPQQGGTQQGPLDLGTNNLIIKTLGCRCCSRLSHTERRPLHDATADSGKCNKHSPVANLGVNRSVRLTNKR